MRSVLYRVFSFTFMYLAFVHSSCAQWADIAEIRIDKVVTELGGPAVEITYQLNASNVTEELPVYVFIRCSMDDGTTWQLINHAYLQGNGFGIVTSAGSKKVTWWGSGLKEGEIPELKIRGLLMVRIPAGEFKMKSFPAGGKDPSKQERPNTNLPEYFMAVNETTNAMYADFLSEMGKDGSWWHNRMANPKIGGITKSDSTGRIIYKPIPGREIYPIIYVSWYDAHAFVNWCGLTLPSEVMWEKAFVGGLFLDGDASKKNVNPRPERNYPWGNEAPEEGGVFRCNIDGYADGYANQAPVGSFSEYQSPYGINDLAGNVAEWTLDWYTTSYHVGLDGFRMVRGGSWMAMPIECDAISGATQFPIKESSIMGFRGAFTK
jgi:formylglycine-generating enzyme required for sulfatase activity